MFTNFTRSIAIASLVLSSSSALLLAQGLQPAEAKQTFAGEIELFLDGALLGDDKPVSSAADLFLHLRCGADVSTEVWGKGMTISEHPGLLDASRVEGSSIQLEVRLLVNGDFWVKGQWPAQYKIRLERKPDGRVEGTYTGSMGGRELSGKVHGQILPARPGLDQPNLPAIDEHPRLLFRKADIPALRKKLETPLGKAYLDRVKNSSDAINLGVLYQLTGEKTYADRAGQILRNRYKGRNGGAIPVFGFGSGGFGHEVFAAAVVYDLCTDAWDDETKSWLGEQFEAFAERQQHILMTSHANFHPCSNYYGPGRGVPGVVSMAIWGEQGELERKPPNPIERAWEIRPPENFQPGKGVTTCKLSLGKVPDSWIWTGLLAKKSSKDVLARIGGYADARPAVGTTAEYATVSGDWFKMVPLTFKALDQAAASEKGIDLGKLADKAEPGIAVFHTAVRVASGGKVHLTNIRKDVRLFISGLEIEADRFYDLKPGLHPMTVEVRSDKLTGLVAPTLQAADKFVATAGMALYEIQRDLWQRDKKLHDKTGMDPRRRLWFRRGWFQNYQHYRWGMGDGGFKAETGGYANIASWYPSQYAAMYRNFTGQGVSAHPDVRMIMPRQIAQAIFAGSGPRIVKLNSALSLDASWMSCHWPILPEKYKPAALWAWNKIGGVAGNETIPNILDGGKRGLRPITLAQTFINYPLDLEPVAPAQSMPKTWSAQTFGFYVHRNGYAGADDFVAQVFAKASPVKGWNHPNAAALTIAGLGQVWTDAPTSRNGVREQYSVVLLPENDINQGSCGRVVHHEAKPDGSGSLTISMNDVYAARSNGLWDGMLQRHPARRKESGITGLRAFGFDYSGASGAEALMVIVDKIEGGDKKIWTWQVPDNVTVKLHKEGFTLSAGGATARATFVTPAKVDLSFGSDSLKVRDARHGFHGSVKRIKAVGDRNFFVIVTFQRNQAPAVGFDRKGLNTRVTIGQQVVTFDGQAVRFEK